jgi:phage terminase large subunit GpA-like protein
VLYLVAAVDVQEGVKNDTSRPERVELMVMGIGKMYRSWVIDYRVFAGSTEDSYGGAWEALYQWLTEQNPQFYNSGGVPFSIELLFADSGDASRTGAGVSRSDIVYRFCGRFSGVIQTVVLPFALPIKGFARMKVRRHEDPDTDAPGAAAYKKYRITPVGAGGEMVVEISTAQYKDALFSRLKIEKTGTENPGGYFEVYASAPDDLLVQLTNSERRKNDQGKYYYHDIGDHEVLDCAVYCLCAADCWLDGRIRALESWYRTLPGRMAAVTDRATLANQVLDRLEANIGQKAKENNTGGKPPP